METVHINNSGDILVAAQKAADTLRAGGVILYPTDTIYGLGADALLDTAVAKIYAIKGRDEGKPMHALVGNIQTLEEYAGIPTDMKEKIEKIIPCPITFIFTKKPGVDTGIAKNMQTFGARIPDNAFCLELARQFEKPFTATSANKSGAETESSVEKILEQLGAAADSIDLVIDAGVLPHSLASTVVDLSSGSPIILREGAVSAEKVHAAFV